MQYVFKFRLGRCISIDVCANRKKKGTKICSINRGSKSEGMPLHAAFSLSDGLGVASDFSHPSIKLFAVLFKLLGDSLFTTLGKISSSLGDRSGTSMLLGRLFFLYTSG